LSGLQAFSIWVTRLHSGFKNAYLDASKKSYVPAAYRGKAVSKSKLVI